MMRSPSLMDHKWLGLIFLLGGSASIASAWGFELIGGYIPCKLCLEQRESYYLALPIVLIAMLGLFKQWPQACLRLLFGIAGLAMLFGALTGAYQAGAEWGFWLGPNDCGAGTSETLDVTQLFSQLQTSKLVSCTEASWRMFGLSFAGWNAVISGGLALLALFAALRPVKS
ncbi:disulfide bond formation protein B [Coralliovum pocilloporae]|uniref:disulfide bond formation protein B n=1 Tax=Coralliovum pocilloporae TaxID=3066369 RepID=UPI0033072659